MKPQLLAIITVACLAFVGSNVNADDRGKLLFEDHFERSESQETTDEIGKVESSARGIPTV